ncbi:hypothetical protein INT48_006933 [Thamnidium elegans]|uniref:Uncharacterized protein n=1 Tax=Thamnidium elegans TaxID=101142 RepID=A0A8H7SWC4_9FUNG|nr:hypothetical protein INT48_006933 [Thamnidium elegans]
MTTYEDDQDFDPIREYCEKQEEVIVVVKKQIKVYHKYSNVLFVYCNREDKDWKTNLVNRAKPQLDANHKLHLLNFYGDYTQTRVVDSMDSLTQKFSDLNLTRAVSHIVLGAVSAKFVFSMYLRNLTEEHSKRIKINLV